MPRRLIWLLALVGILLASACASSQATNTSVPVQQATAEQVSVTSTVYEPVPVIVTNPRVTDASQKPQPIKGDGALRIQIPSLGLDLEVYVHAGAGGEDIYPRTDNGKLALWAGWGRFCDPGGFARPLDNAWMTGDVLLLGHRNTEFRSLAENGLQDGAVIRILNDQGNVVCTYVSVASEFEASVDKIEASGNYAAMKASEPDSVPTLWLVTCDPGSTVQGLSANNLLFKAVFVGYGPGIHHQ